MRLRLEPDFVVDERGDTHDGPVLIDGDRITAIGEAAEVRDAQRVPLAGRMLLPGFTNAHSHAFQRVLRGRVEQRDPNTERDDFWSWRALMYSAALALDLDEIEAVTAWCYADMLKSGFVPVGECHYLHHGRDGFAYDDPIAVSRRIAAAAASTGIHLTLLQTAYGRAGPARPPSADQRRFVFEDVADFLSHARESRAELTGPRVRTGLAVHSERACTREWIEAIATESCAQNLPLHVHACEQPAEIEACTREHGLTPIALLEAADALHAHTTIVHATHLEEADPARLASSGATVCLCPSTERNLGDGLCPIGDLAAAGVPLAIGSDSHARIDVADELRSLEDHERLRLLHRTVLVAPGDSLRHIALPAGTVAGSAAIGRSDSGRMAAGAMADLVTVETPLEAAASRGAAVDAWLVGGSGRDVRDVFAAGERVVQDGRLTRVDEDELTAAVRPILRRLR